MYTYAYIYIYICICINVILCHQENCWLNSYYDFITNVLELSRSTFRYEKRPTKETYTCKKRPKSSTATTALVQTCSSSRVPPLHMKSLFLSQKRLTYGKRDLKYLHKRDLKDLHKRDLQKRPARVKRDPQAQRLL